MARSPGSGNTGGVHHRKKTFVSSRPERLWRSKKQIPFLKVMLMLLVWISMLPASWALWPKASLTKPPSPSDTSHTVGNRFLLPENKPYTDRFGVATFNGSGWGTILDLPGMLSLTSM